MAASTARSTSSGPQFATSVSTVSVAGFSVCSLLAAGEEGSRRRSGAARIGVLVNRGGVTHSPPFHVVHVNRGGGAPGVTHSPPIRAPVLGSVMLGAEDIARAALRSGILARDWRSIADMAEAVEGGEGGERGDRGQAARGAGQRKAAGLFAVRLAYLQYFALRIR